MFVHVFEAEFGLPSERTAELFRRFKETPGLLHAYSLQRADDPAAGMVIGVWESRDAYNQYLEHSPLRREADVAVRGARRTLYDVLDRK